LSASVLRFGGWTVLVAPGHIRGARRGHEVRFKSAALSGYLG
jgi:hypothetical protein